PRPARPHIPTTHTHSTISPHLALVRASARLGRTASTHPHTQEPHRQIPPAQEPNRFRPQILLVRIDLCRQALALLVLPKRATLTDDEGTIRYSKSVLLCTHIANTRCKMSYINVTIERK